MLAGLCRWSAVRKYQNGMAKVTKNVFNMGRSGTQYVVMVTDLLSSYWRGHLVESYCKVSNISDTNKTFTNKRNKRKNRALLTLRRSQKQYEIFGNNVLRKNINRKQLRLETIEIAWFKVASVPGLWEILFHILCIAWLRDLQSETCLPCSKEKRSYNWPYRRIYIWICSKGFDQRQGFIFSPENSTIASGEVNTILFITARAFQ